MALKRKKRYEEQLRRLDGTLQTIDFQREALENANINTEVLQGMRQAARALQSAHRNMDVDQVHDLMDDVAEQHEISQEIADAISNPVAFGQQYDEDDLLAELDELEQEELDKTLLPVEGPSSGKLPDIPTAEPREAIKTRKAPKSADEDDLRELQAWAS